MEPIEFDALSRTLTGTPTRRRALRVFLGATLGGWLTAQRHSAAAKKRKKRKKRKDRDQETSTPLPSDAAPPSSPPGCPSGQKPCDGGCIPSSQCCDDTDCPVAGQVCTPARQCACPAGLPEVCGGACRAATCLPADQVTRNPDSCECCARNGQQTDGTLPCCSERVHVLDYGPLGRAYYCASRGAGEACSFNAQCYSNFCLCGAFGCGCQ